MLILDIKDLKKYYGHRLILKIEDLKVYSGEKVGLVGLNGSGKTTLLNLISGEIKPDEGFIKTLIKPFYLKQLEDSNNIEVSTKYISKLGLRDKAVEFMSGGEKTRLKIAEFFTSNRGFLLADEPTSNLDIKGSQFLSDELLGYDGTMIVISHDRDFLDKVCNRIIEIEDGRISSFTGNYTDYREQKELEKKTQELKYDKYISEKRRLEKTLYDVKMRSSKINGPPKRMGISEARLHRMGGQNAKKTLDNTAKAIASRIERLEKVEKVKEIEKINLDIEGVEIYSKIIIEGVDIRKEFGKRTLFNNLNFQIENKSKVALMGDNGTGKTTLLKMILDKEKNIKISQSAKIGYFSQDMNILDLDKTIIDNILESSIYPEQNARHILARLLFKREDIYKKVGVISGGERVKVSLAKILLSDFNVLMLDEPTNYLDIYSIEAVEEALLNYSGTLIIVSHDRRLIESVADKIMVIEDQDITTFKGGLKEFDNRSIIHKNQDILLRRAVLENRLSEIIGLLSISSNEEEKKELDLEYNKIIQELKAKKIGENS